MLIPIERRIHAAYPPGQGQQDQKSGTVYQTLHPDLYVFITASLQLAQVVARVSRPTLPVYSWSGCPSAAAGQSCRSRLSGRHLHKLTSRNEYEQLHVQIILGSPSPGEDLVPE